MKVIRTLLLAALLVAASSGAGTLRAMTLAEAVGYAMDHNPDILAARQDVAQRDGQVIEARADAMPQLDIMMEGYRVRDPGFLNSTFGQELLKGGGGSTGGEGGFEFPIEAILPKPQTFYDVKLNFSQPLFTWGKVGNAMKAARLGRQEMDLALETKRQQVAYDATNAYYDVLLAEENIRIYEQAIETQERYLKQTTDFFEVGDGTRLQVLRAESQLAQTRPELISAQNELVQARKRLNFVLGRELETEVVTVEVEFDENAPVPGLDSVRSAASVMRPDLRELNTRVQFYDKTVNVFKADFRPRADLNGYYGFSTINTDDMFDRNFEAWRVALQVSIPVFDGLRTRGQVKQYTAIRERNRIEYNKLGDQIDLESRQAIDDCASARLLYQARERAMASSDEEERVAQDQYEQSLITMYDLMDTNRRALQARVDFQRSRYDLLRKVAELKKVMGVPVDELF